MTYNLPVFYIDGMLTTQAIKLNAGDYILEEFILMNDNGTPEILDDDLIVMASVNEEGEFASYVEMTLPYEFTVEAFLKIELHVEVICYYPEFYYWYGFEFFTVWITNIHEWYFFGDLCLEYPELYEGSLYELQTEGLQADVPAIFEIEVWRNEEYLGTFSNEFCFECFKLLTTFCNQLNLSFNNCLFVCSEFFNFAGKSMNNKFF